MPLKTVINYVPNKNRIIVELLKGNKTGITFSFCSFFPDFVDKNINKKKNEIRLQKYPLSNDPGVYREQTCPLYTFPLGVSPCPVFLVRR